MRKYIVSYNLAISVVLMISITINVLAGDYSSNNDNAATRSTSNNPPVLEKPSVADIKRALGIGRVRSIVYSAAPGATSKPASGFGTIIEFDSNSTTVFILSVENCQYSLIRCNRILE